MGWGKRKCLWWTGGLSELHVLSLRFTFHVKWAGEHVTNNTMLQVIGMLCTVRKDIVWPVGTCHMYAMSQ